MKKSLINTVVCAFSMFLKPTHCNSVFSDVDVVDYCTYQRSMCTLTGTYVHVVCEFYGQTGSDCVGFKELPLSPAHVALILKRINAIRGEVAMGQVIGKNKKLLPRGFGMMKISWDKDLAAFAKIMIRQCPKRLRNNCAATRNFTDPIMIYDYGNPNVDYTTRKLIDEIFAKWRAALSNITPMEIYHSPNLKTGEPLNYIKILVGIASRIGCATATYGNEIKNRNIVDKDNLLVSGRIVCYLSHYSKKQAAVYNTTEPIPDTMWTKCGCPPDFRETKNCLCVRYKGSGDPNITTYGDSPPTYFTPKVYTTSTQAHYNKYENYEKYVNEMFDRFQKSIISSGTTSGPWLTVPTLYTRKTTASVITTDWIPAHDTTIKEKLDYKTTTRIIPSIIIDPPALKTMAWNSAIRNKKEKWTDGHTVKKIKGPTALPRAGSEIPPHCDTGIKCLPRIVMLPVFSLQNVRKHNRRRGPGYIRRFGNTTSIQSTKADDDFSFDEEDELPQNISLRSKLLQTVRKIRKNENVDFFSKEQNLETVHQLVAAMERNKSILEPIERNLEPYKNILKPPERNLEPSECNSESPERNLEPSERILEPTERGELESVTRISVPNFRVETMVTQSLDDGNEQAKKRAMGLLEQIEQTGRKAKLNSREILQFDDKMRRIHKTLMGTRDRQNVRV